MTPAPCAKPAAGIRRVTHSAAICLNMGSRDSSHGAVQPSLGGFYGVKGPDGDLAVVHHRVHPNHPECHRLRHNERHGAKRPLVDVPLDVVRNLSDLGGVRCSEQGGEVVEHRVSPYVFYVMT